LQARVVLQSIDGLFTEPAGLMDKYMPNIAIAPPRKVKK